MTNRIRWDEVAEGNPPAIRGYVHLFDKPLFEIRPPSERAEWWTLTSELPGWNDRELTGDGDAGPGPLQAAAEEWLGAFLASIGAAWPDEPAPQTEG